MANGMKVIEPEDVVGYLAAALAGDESAAGGVVDQARSAGVSITDVYLQLFVPAQRELGFRWSAGEISVANEHLATEITARLMDRLRESAFRKPQLGKRVVVAAAPLERHAMGARIVADFFHLDGWQVDFLGADLPAEELGSFVRETQPDLVALSVVLTQELATVQEAVEQARSAAPDAKVMLGGPAIVDEDQARQLGADGYAIDALQATEIARALVGVSQGISLEQLLTILGEKVQSLRHSRGWNQQQLADLAGLDRTYVSTVENGKQNLTLSALHRLATALEVEAGSLLSTNYGTPG